MKIFRSTSFLVAAAVFLLISIPLTTYLVLNSSQVGRDSQASTLVCEANCVSGEAQSNPQGQKEDLNQDGKVNTADVAILVANFGKTGDNPADLNGDKIVDETDSAILKAKFSN